MIQYTLYGISLPQIATPVFGYKSHISIDRQLGFIRQSLVTSAAAPHGRQLKALVTTDNPSSKIWADSAYCSKTHKNLPVHLNRYPGEQSLFGERVLHFQGFNSWEAVA